MSVSICCDSVPQNKCFSWLMLTRTNSCLKSCSWFLWLLARELVVRDILRSFLILVIFVLGGGLLSLALFRCWLCSWPWAFLCTVVSLAHELEESEDERSEQGPHQEVVDILILVIVDKSICNEWTTSTMSFAHSHIVEPALWSRCLLLLEIFLHREIWCCSSGSRCSSYHLRVIQGRVKALALSIINLLTPDLIDSPQYFQFFLINLGLLIFIVFEVIVSVIKCLHFAIAGLILRRLIISVFQLHAIHLDLS